MLKISILGRPMEMGWDCNSLKKILRRDIIFKCMRFTRTFVSTIAKAPSFIMCTVVLLRNEGPIFHNTRHCNVM